MKEEENILFIIRRFYIIVYSYSFILGGLFYRRRLLLLILFSLLFSLHLFKLIAFSGPKATHLEGGWERVSERAFFLFLPSLSTVILLKINGEES